MTRDAKRRIWLVAIAVFALVAAWWWIETAREGLASGTGLVAISASVGAVFSFLGWSQVPPKAR